MNVPRISDAKALAQRFDLAGCVIFYLTPDGQVGLASYGRNRKICKALGRWADKRIDEITAGKTELTEDLVR